MVIRLVTKAQRQLQKHWKQNKHYRDNLGGNNIGDEGATAIAKALETNTTLSSWIVYNKIGYEGATAIAKAMETNTTLSDLNSQI